MTGSYMIRTSVMKWLNSSLWQYQNSQTSSSVLRLTQVKAMQITKIWLKPVFKKSQISTNLDKLAVHCSYWIHRELAMYYRIYAKSVTSKIVSVRNFFNPLSGNPANCRRIVWVLYHFVELTLKGLMIILNCI